MPNQRRTTGQRPPAHFAPRQAQQPSSRQRRRPSGQQPQRRQAPSPLQKRRSSLLLIVVELIALFMVGFAIAWGTGAFRSGDEDNAPATSQGGSTAEPSAEERLASQVAEKLDAMTLEQKVAQLFIVRPEALTGVGQVVAAGDATKEALERMPVGGVIYFATNLEDADQTREMLANTQAYGQEVTGLPLFLCVDEEGGTVSRVGGNEGFDIENVGNMSEIGATGDVERAREVAVQIGTYLTDLGFNVDFAPDADIANNPMSDTMALRSFGSTADAVAPMVKAQIEGFTQTGILCAAKHFPGIGGAEGDSHDTSIYSQKTVDEIRDEELVPFQTAIEADVPFVMVGHLSMPNVTGDDDPASVSSEIVTDLLRNDMGYDGIIITDSMGMGAATSSIGNDRIAVEALKAGVDIVLMPADLEAAYQGVLDALDAGELDEARIDASVERILKVKLGKLSAQE